MNAATVAGSGVVIAEVHMLGQSSNDLIAK
jgi:hypothetical protein